MKTKEKLSSKLKERRMGGEEAVRARRPVYDRGDA